MWRMSNLNQFLRMSRWAHKPPGWRQVRLVRIVLAACLVLYGIDRVFGWPAWLTLDETPKGRINR
jgi:hypothetical protein